MTKRPFCRPSLAPLLAAALAAALFPLPASAEDGGIATLSQIGEGNAVTIQQKFVASGGLPGQQNAAAVTQSGTGNHMDISQDGNALTASVTQSGTGNGGIIDQSGTGHTANVIQNGAGHAVDVKQSGDTPHTVTVTQFNFLATASDPAAVVTGSGQPGSTVTVRQF